MCAPGATGQLRLFIGDRAHIPMYIALSRSSCTQAQQLLRYQIVHTWHTVQLTNTERIVEGAVVAVPSHFPQVVLAQDAQCKLEFSNAMVRNRWSPNQRQQSKAPLVEGNSLVVHHSGAPQPAPWWDQSVTGGTNPGPREPPCPGQPRPRTLLG